MNEEENELTQIQEVPPIPNRPVMMVYNGKLFALPIVDFVILKCYGIFAGVFEQRGYDEDQAAQFVSDHSASVAVMLIREGWFSQEEYLENIAVASVAEMDDDIRELLGGS